mmetsp:Transcript_117293/g.356912  ORF Transcript_117293/g.356912 Transcript_117293/m.356912 type:complete len:202 (-) Transcript_117293:193-798(-)
MCWGQHRRLVVKLAGVEDLAALFHDEPDIAYDLPDGGALLSVQAVLVGGKHTRELLHRAAAHDVIDEISAGPRRLVAMADEAPQHHRQSRRRVVAVEQHSTGDLAGLPLCRGGVEDVLRKGCCRFLPPAPPLCACEASQQNLQQHPPTPRVQLGKLCSALEVGRCRVPVARLLRRRSKDGEPLRARRLVFEDCWVILPQEP